jgi:hypothetical protein
MIFLLALTMLAPGIAEAGRRGRGPRAPRGNMVSHPPPHKSFTGPHASYNRPGGRPKPNHPFTKYPKANFGGGNKGNNKFANNKFTKGNNKFTNNKFANNKFEKGNNKFANNKFEKGNNKFNKDFEGGGGKKFSEKFANAGKGFGKGGKGAYSFIKNNKGKLALGGLGIATLIAGPGDMGNWLGDKLGAITGQIGQFGKGIGEGAEKGFEDNKPK